MKLVQIGANKGNDDLAKYIKKYHKSLDFALFVEANPLHIEDLKKCYEGYDNVFIENIAIKPSSFSDDLLTLYCYEDDAPLYAVTSCIKSHLFKHYGNSNFSEDKIHSFQVPALTIDELFAKYNIKELDWLSLDIEGIDAEILLDVNWDQYDIKRIEYEELHLGIHRESIEKIFKNLNYVKTIPLHHYDDAWIKPTGEITMNVTLYAICKNEEKNIEKFIENSKKFSHTVVVDTGSTDNTIQLLKDAGIEVYQHPQEKKEFNFSVARNQALSYVKTDWAFSLDFNEDVDNLFLEGFVPIESEFTCFKHLRYDDNGDGQPKQSNEVHTRFHRTENYKWVHAVHEMPVFVPTENYSKETSVDTTISITKKIQKSISKELFYLSICEREYEKYPNEWYYVWFIFNHYSNVKNFQKAIEFGQEFLNISKPYFDTFRISVFIKCSQMLFSLGDISRAANYAFHALSEAMNMGEPYMSQAFSYLIEVGKITQNPNIIIFASGFNSDTLSMKERTDSIDKLFFTNLDDVPATAWFGHRKFAEWLVKFMNPKVTVDLGVDWGFSTFSFAIPRIGHVYGIDNFVGDSFVGIDKERAKYDFVMTKREKLHLKDNLTIIEGDFTEVSKTWDKEIDILHIDGSHYYEDIKNDFETWSKFVKDDGIILIHDTCIEDYMGNGYGVKKFFEEINLPKFTFTHSFGLGIISKNQNLIDTIKSNFQ